jgi:hypothetical protein
VTLAERSTERELNGSAKQLKRGYPAGEGERRAAGICGAMRRQEGSGRRSDEASRSVRFLLMYHNVMQQGGRVWRVERKRRLGGGQETLKPADNVPNNAFFVNVAARYSLGSMLFQQSVARCRRSARGRCAEGQIARSIDKLRQGAGGEHMRE